MKRSLLISVLLLLTLSGLSHAQKVALWITGDTTSATYPSTNGSACQGCPRENGAFTELLRNTGHTSTSANFSAYVGGAFAGSGFGQIRTLWIDSVSGDVFIGGRTSCTNLAGSCNIPIVAGSFQTTYAGGGDEAYIARFTSAGVLIWASYLGTNGTAAEETVYGIAGLDGSGNVAFCGRLNGRDVNGNMPATMDGVTWTRIGTTPPTGNDVSYIAKAKGDGTALVWFTSFSSSNANGADGIRGRCTMDASGNVFAGGESSGTDFPTTATVFGKTKNSALGVTSGIVVNMKSDGSAFNWATYVSGSCSNGSPCQDNADGGIVLDGSNNVFVCGQTGSSDLLTKNGSPTGYQTAYASPAGAHSASQYCFKIKSDGTSVLNATFLGGNAGTFTAGAQTNEANSVNLDGSGNAVVLGETYDTNWPCGTTTGCIAGAFQTTLQASGKKSITLAKLDSTLTTLQAATYWGGNNITACDHSGGIGFATSGDIYASCGGTTSTNLSALSAVTSDGYQTSYIGSGNSRDAVIFGVNAAMTSVVYGTYLGTGVQSSDTDGTFGWAFSVTNPVTPTVATPTFSPVAGTYNGTQNVTISTTTPAATLCYTTDGSTPTANGAGTCTHGTTYTTAVAVSVSETLKAIGSLSGDNDSAVGSAAYVINSALSSPTFSPNGGSFLGSQNLTITVPVGSTGCYTTDGSTPTGNGAGTCTHGTTYSGAFVVSVSEQVQAVATQSGHTDSSASGVYFTIGVPTFLPGTGNYTPPQTVTIACPAGQPTPTIYYTTDSTTPTHSSPSGSTVVVGQSLTLKAICAATNYPDSQVGSAIYTILLGNCVNPNTTYDIVTTVLGWAWAPPGGGNCTCKLADVDGIDPANTVKFGTANAWAAQQSAGFRNLGYTDAGQYSYAYASHYPANGMPYVRVEAVTGYAIKDTTLKDGHAPFHVHDATYQPTHSSSRCGGAIFGSSGNINGSETLDPFDPNAPAAVNYVWSNLYPFDWPDITKSQYDVANEGDEEFCYNQYFYHVDCGLLILINKPSITTSGGGFNYVTGGYSAEVYAKEAARDYVLEYYLCTGNGTPAGGFCTANHLGTGSADPANASYVGSTNASNALSTMNTAWGTSYSTWNTIDAAGLAGLKNGTYSSASWGSGATEGFLDENGGNVVNGTVSCSGGGYNGPGVTSIWATTTAIQTVMELFVGYMAAQEAKLQFNGQTAVCGANCPALVMTLYNGPTYVYTAMQPYADAFLMGFGVVQDNRTLAGAEADVQATMNATTKPLIVGDYIMGGNDSPTSQNCIGSGFGQFCVNGQANRATNLLAFWNAILPMKNLQSKFAVIGLSHWQKQDQTGLNDGVMTGVDNLYDGSQASTVNTALACAAGSYTQPYICTDANGFHESLITASCTSTGTGFASGYYAITTEGATPCQWINVGNYALSPQAANYGNFIGPIALELNAGICDPSTNNQSVPASATILSKLKRPQLHWPREALQ